MKAFVLYFIAVLVVYCGCSTRTATYRKLSQNQPNGRSGNRLANAGAASEPGGVIVGARTGAREYTIQPTGPHSRIWQRVTNYTANGRTFRMTNQFTEL